MDILNLKEIESYLENLSVSSVAKFGKMTPQHMVEHLVFSVMFSNGKMPQKLLVSEEKAMVAKDYFIVQNNNFKPGYKIPLLGKEPPELVFGSLIKAKENLINELTVFELYFKENPNKSPVNIIMGALNKQEWIVMHNKHFEHHFRQFGIEV